MKTKMILVTALILCLGSFFMISCQSASSTSSSTNKTLSDTDAKAYSEMGVNLSQQMTGSIVGWAQVGSVNGISPLSAASASSLRTSTITDEGNGWSHLSDTTTEALGTLTADLHIKLDKDASGEVIGVWVYGSLALSVSAAGNNYTYKQTYGNGINDPYHGTITRTGSSITNVALAGKSTFTVDLITASITVSVDMIFNYSNFSLPITSGSDYPNGKITITSVVHNGVAQPDIIITFNGTNIGTIDFGGSSISFIIQSI